MKVAGYSKTGTKTADITLDGNVFGNDLNPELVAQAYGRYLSNRRTNNAQTLTRGLVAGGGKKPWRQKGTGRARSGSIRNPIWRGGGIIFGPTGQENYSKDLPRKATKLALAQALSAQAKQIKVIESLSLNDYSTSTAVKLLSKLELEGNIVLVAEKISLQTAKSFANIPGVEIMTPQSLNVFCVMNADGLVFEKVALDQLVEWLKPARNREVGK